MKLFFPGFVLIAFLLVACAGAEETAVPARTAQNSLDSVEFHVFRGDDALQENRYLQALESYNRALDVDPDNVAALAGAATALAFDEAGKNPDSEQRKESFARAEIFLKRAEKNMKTPDEKGRYFTAVVAVNVSLQSERDWYEKALENLEAVREIPAEDHAAKFYVAKAHVERGEYSKAEKLLGSVMDDGGRFSDVAEVELRTVQKIRRARPGTRFGNNIATSDRVSRAEVAALLVTEFNLSSLYARNIEEYNRAYSVPENQRRFRTQVSTEVPDATDISLHPHRRAIEEVLSLKLRGLEADPSHLFYPDRPLSRGEFALLIEDLLIKITDDRPLKTKYFGQDSPYRDVRDDVFYYNAVRVAVERNLLELEDKVTATFAPEKPVTGADAVLAIRELKKAVESVLKR